MLSLEMKDGEQLKAKAKEIFSRKNVEYLAIDLSGEHRELRLDHIASFTHPELGTVVVSAE
ncbi:Rho-specific inhibitor of transcription termination (YaeO) [Pantoea agglomerans 299R]|jgi:Rho-binding antiterminator|nr:Rho-specific inhibitor of transcription termination (YaeO) [Pantoea agglomerans 299R]KEY42065.1 protein rof [Pantoea agglomerans]